MDTTVVIPPVFDGTTVIAFLIGTVLPLGIAYVRGHYASSRYATALAFGVCVVVAALVTVIGKTYQGAWSPSPAANAQLIALNIVAILMSAWSTFARLWQPLGAIDALEKVGPQLGDRGATTT